MVSKPWKVVITDCDHGFIDEERKECERIGAELILAQVREEEDLIRACKDADALLNQYAPLTRRVLENLPKCKVIARYGPPHVGFYSEESIHELKRRAAEIASTVLLGKWPKSVVNPEVMGKTRAFISKPLV